MIGEALHCLADDRGPYTSIKSLTCFSFCSHSAFSFSLCCLNSSFIRLNSSLSAFSLASSSFSSSLSWQLCLLTELELPRNFLLMFLPTHVSRPRLSLCTAFWYRSFLNSSVRSSRGTACSDSSIYSYNNQWHMILVVCKPDKI